MIASAMEQRRIIEKTPAGWAGIEREGYVPGVATNVIRHTLIGGRKDDVSDPGPTNEVRYFELPPQSVTRLEKHEHEHYVIVGHGVGHAIVGDAVREVRQHDVVYIGPFVPHQFVNRGAESFGFFCMVSSVRDFSQELSPVELERLLASPAGAYADPHGAPPPRRAALT
jgi:mannose-6-phosphate isomerase-like protein (cupin superfamily)